MKNLYILFLLVILVYGSSVSANDDLDGKSQSIAVEKILCQQLYKHTPKDDVSFQAGVDVDGNAVVPADIGTSPPISTAWQVPVTLDLAERLNLSSLNGVEMKAQLGVLQISKNGTVEFNGMDITSQVTSMCSGSLPNEMPLPTKTMSSETDSLSSVLDVENVAPPIGSLAPEKSADSDAMPASVSRSTTVTQ